MKKSYVFILSCVLFFALGSISAQNIIYYEDFSDGMPPEYSLFDLDGNTPNPNVSEYTDAWIVLGGAASSTSWYSPVGTSNDWMITGAIELPDLQDPDNKTILSWGDFAPDENYLDGYKVMVSTKAAHPDSFDTELFSIDAAANDPAFTTRTVDIADYAGDTVYIAFINNSVDKFRLYIDDILITEARARGIAAVDVTNPRYINQPSADLDFNFRSFGYEAVNSFKYVFDNGAGIIDTVDVDGTSLEYLGTEIQAHPETVDPGYGTLSCNIRVIEINGQSFQGETYTEDLQLYEEANTVSRKPLIETFTSSTCAPCKPGNEQLHSVFDGLNEPPVTLKWQQNFPGSGDPYCTDETINRRLYYGISAIPNTNVDATYFDDNTINIVASDITGAQNRGALVEIDAQYEIDVDNQLIRVFGTMTSAVDLLDENRLMIAVREQLTVNNVATNGETEFLDVVKKVLPDQNGIYLPAMEAGEEYSFDETYVFPGDYRLPANGLSENRIDLTTEHSVEEFSDLAATVWVEYPDDHIVLGAANASQATAIEDIEQVEEFVMSPNPVRNQDIRLSLILNESRTVGFEIFDLRGKSVYKELQGMKNGTVETTLPTAGLEAGAYFLKVYIGEESFVDRFIKQ